MSITIGFAAESGHWYRPDGQPAYTILGKNGKERPTTLADARKLGLLPSATGIIKMAAAPGLERWKAEQVLMAALTLPRGKDELEAAWISRVWDDSKEQGRKAAERGTAIHAAIERSLGGFAVPDEFLPFVKAARDAIDLAYPMTPWNVERSFASPEGYGGKVDLFSERDEIVLDVKTKDGDLSKVKCYDEHFMQAAAYAHGLGMKEPRCGIVFVNRELPALSILIEHSKEDTERGWTMFMALLEYWKAKTGLDTAGKSA